MSIDKSLLRCVLCNQAPSDSYEHIIPDCIGGTLQVQILCADCNSKLGSQVVSAAKKDLVIRLAIIALKDEIPNVYNAFEESQPYVGVTKAGDRIQFRKNGDNFVARHTSLPDSVITDSKVAKRNLKKEMLRKGVSQKQVAEAIDRISALPPDLHIPISDEIFVCRPSLKDFDIDYKYDEIDDRFASLIAYEFLALLIGDDIYDWYFDEIRAYLRDGEPCSKVKVERFRVDRQGYRPIHTLMLNPMPQETIVDIILFDWIWYRVTYSKLCVHTRPYVYRDIISDRVVQLAESKDKALAGEFIDLSYVKFPPKGRKGKP
jgi:hypothetical protein